MIRVFLCLLIFAVGSAAAGDVHSEIKAIEVELTDVVRSADELIASRSSLQERLNAADEREARNQQLSAELEEIRAVLDTLAEREQDDRDRLRKLRESEEFRITNSIQNDKRRPTKADVSGVWNTAPNLTGFTLQLEQRGQSITGQGYYWGCVGVYDTFEVTGTYKDEVLSLTLVVSADKQTKCVYTYSGRGPTPRFRSKDAKRFKELSAQANAL